MTPHKCHRQKCFILFIFIISALISPCRGRSGGHGSGGGHGGSSSGGRGSSAARGNVGSRGSTSIGHSIGTGPGHFGSGTGFGSASRADSFKTSFVSSSAANTYHHNQPFYYYGNHYYLGGHSASKLNAGEIQCKMPLDTLFNLNAPLSNSSKLTNETLTNGPFSMTNVTLSVTNGTWPATWTNGTRLKHIVWTCKKDVAQCCGIECCPTSAAAGANDGTFSIVLRMLLILLGISLICFCLFGWLCFESEDDEKDQSARDACDCCLSCFCICDDILPLLEMSGACCI
uniref:CX domain-containing protein n=1 Tax=Globodera rostochiensis TaxID=31243 RepID=A0A914GZC5_GLORO